tara:strand:- start:818 stop:1372 length:555 start_codon:yes stop_codon:yes gene_type:complete
MTDNQMMIYIIAEIERQLTLVGITDFEVGRNQQPTNQYTGGSKDDPIKTRVFLYTATKGSDGHGRSYTPEDGAEPFKRTDFQQKNKAIQVSVVHSFDETDINARTPEDMSDLIHDLLDSPDAVASLRVNKIFLQEVSDVRPIFFTNDKDRFESLPNFDLQVNYSSAITKVAGYVDVSVGDFEGV